MSGSLSAFTTAFGALSRLGNVLQLGSFIFDESQFEVPESIGTLGGRQTLEQHDFPGGIRTHQVFGAFPEAVEWKGMFTGTFAWDRMLAVDAIRVAGREVLLRYGSKAFMGRLAFFDPHPRSSWLIPYTIRFAPRIDISQGEPSNGEQSPETQLADQTTGLTELSNGIPFTLPTSLTSPISGLLTTVSGALSGANGILDNIGSISAAGIFRAATAVIGAATPLFNAASPNNSFMARSAAYRATTISQITQHPISAPFRTIETVNPSFPTLAAQYLGDAGRWRDIAYFNGMSDPQPIGSFTINIPNQNTTPIPRP